MKPQRTILNLLLKSKLQTGVKAGCRSISTTSHCDFQKKPEVTRHLTDSYCHGIGSAPFIGATLGETLLRTVERTPDQECVVFCEDGIRKTFSEFMKEVDQFAASLHKMGIRKGDCIGIWGPSTLEWVVTQFASARIGAILVNVNPAYQLGEAEFALNLTKMKAIVSSASYKTQDYYAMLAELAPELATCGPAELKSKRLPHLSTIIMMGEKQFPGTFRYQDAMQLGTPSDVAEVHNISRGLDFDEPINVQFTSGTTGRPKGATLSHHNIINNVRYIGERLGYDDYYHRIACQVPLYHCFGMVGGPVAMAVYGSGIIFPCAGYDPATTLKTLEKEKCSVIYGTPTMYIDMYSHPDIEKYDYTTVEKGIMAGSPCPPEVVYRSDKAFGAKIMVGYGTTENSPVTFLNFLDDTAENRAETVGMPASQTEVKIVDENGNIVPVNTPGELLIRGYCVMLGYWEAQDKTDECITSDGWYKTGDIGTLDEKGYGRIVGRTKDMIIRGGENIYPTEIEDFLHTMEEIENVQVFGMPDERLGEVVAAWICLKEGKVVTEEDIRRFCKGKMAHFKIPQYIKFVKEYPLTVTRKIQKFKMQEVYAKELGLKH